MRFHTMEALERDRGHFYNWYDTQSLKPLTPKYISTVDSGNLAAHLLTLRPGLLALPDHKILGPQVFDGLNDTLKVLVNVAGEGAPALLARIKKDVVSASGSPPTTLTAARQSLDHLAAFAAEVAAEPSVPLIPIPTAKRTGGRAPLSGNARMPSMI